MPNTGKGEMMKTVTSPVYQGRQRTPGHYVALLETNSSQNTMASFLPVFGNRGFLKRYLWNSLEPAQGQFDLSALVDDVAWCAAHGMKLIAFLVDKSFTGGAAAHVLPKGMWQYELPNHAGSGTVPGTPSYGGVTSMRWKLPVQQEFNKLTAAIGKALNSQDAFEGVATVETSLSLDTALAVKNGYTPELYRDSYINILSTGAANMPQSQVFWFMNFLPGGQQYIGDVATAVRDLGVIMCGPDNLPNSPSLTANVYPFYAAQAGRMTMGIQMSNPGYAVPHQPPANTPFWTMQEMLDYARATLFSNYMFWMPIKKNAGSLSYGYADAIPVIGAQPVINP